MSEKPQQPEKTGDKIRSAKQLQWHPLKKPKEITTDRGEFAFK